MIGVRPSELLADLEDMPRELERAIRFVSRDRLSFRPESWAGCPSENFSALEHACHLRDIERDGYRVRIHRMLREKDPVLESLDGYELARAHRYADADVDEALHDFRAARADTVATLRGVTPEQWERKGTFDEYGPLTLRSLIHYLRSHDQQHLSGLQWLAGKIASDLP